MSSKAFMNWDSTEKIPLLIFTILLAVLATINGSKLWRIISTAVSRLRFNFMLISWRAKRNGSNYKVSQLHTYPVKSLRALDHKTIQIETRGLMGDRQFMLVTPAPLPAWGSFGPHEATHRFFTQRQCPSLATVVVTYADQQQSFTLTSHLLPNEQVTTSLQPAKDSPTYRATLWNDCVLVQDMGDAAAAFLQSVVDQDDSIPDDLKALPVRLVIQCDTRIADDKYIPPAARGWFGQGPTVALSDGFPILIANERSLNELNRRLREKGKEPLSMTNFRPNIVVSGSKIPFEEDRWKVIRIGGKAIFHVVKGCPRCKQSCTNQLTGAVSEEPLETMAEFRALDTNPSNVYFAQNVVPSPCSVGQSIAVGDSVEVLEWGEPVWGD